MATTTASLQPVEPVASVDRLRLVALLVCLPACGRLGFESSVVGDIGGADAGPRGCAASQILGAGGAPTLPGVYGAAEAPILEVGPDRIGCVYRITVDGAGGGRGNHDNPPDNADGGDGGRIVFELVPDRVGSFAVVIGGGGAGTIATGTLDDPGPGAGGGGSSEIAFVPAGEAPRMLAIAGGGGGGGWAERGSHGGGAGGECGGNADEGSTGGCAGMTGIPHVGGEPGGDCPLVGASRTPCGGPGGAGSYGPGGFGVGAGFGGDEAGNQGSGGGGGGYGGGSAGGDAGDPGLGGGAYFVDDPAILVSGATGGADNGARYADSLALAGGDGRVVLEVRPP